MKFLHEDGRHFFLLGIRLFFGIWLLYVGVTKWLFMGPNTFVGYITSQFDKTWSPHLLNMVLSWVILITEPILGILILSGKKARIVWSLAALFMFMLTVGETMLMKADLIGNWQFTVLTLACATLSDPNS